MRLSITLSWSGPKIKQPQEDGPFNCLLFSFVFLVAEVILALSLSGAKKANQNSGILPSLVVVGCTVKKNLLSQGFSL